MFLIMFQYYVIIHPYTCLLPKVSKLSFLREINDKHGPGTSKLHAGNIHTCKQKYSLQFFFNEQYQMK